MKKTILLFFSLFLLAASSDVPENQTIDLVKFTDANFKKSVLDKKGLIVVEFWAEWCGPCRMVEPILKELANDYSNKVSFGKLNVDFEQKISLKYEIKSIPTILIFKDGTVMDKYVGVISKKDLKKKIDVLF